MGKKTSIRVWNHVALTKKIRINKNGIIDSSAEKAFSNGHCHSLALAIHALTGWPIYGLIGESNSPKSPGHLVVKNPETGDFIDIRGSGAVSRWREAWSNRGETAFSLQEYTEKEVLGFDEFLLPDVEKAIPFAKKLLEKLGYDRKPSPSAA